MRVVRDCHISRSQRSLCRRLFAPARTPAESAMLLHGTRIPATNPISMSVNNRSRVTGCS
jgi:hypothetical protein